MGKDKSIKKFLLEIPEETWAKWKNTVPLIPAGSQYMNLDNSLCTHHVIYWTYYRMKYGNFNTTKKKVVDNFNQTEFLRFAIKMREKANKLKRSSFKV